MNPRPLIYDNEVAEAASHIVAKEVYFWQNHTRKITDEKELEEIRLALVHVLDYSKDGYEMAKAMEERFFEADSQLVEIMDDAAHTMYDCHQKRVEQWVIDNNIQPKLCAGDVVVIKPNRQTEPMQGKVLSVSTSGATYAVCFPGLGHVESGLGTHALILSYEYVEDQITDELL